MDFSLSALIAGTIALVLLFSSLYIYYRRLYGITDRITTETNLALRAFGLSIVGLGLMFPVSIFLPSLVPLCMGIAFLGMINSQMRLSLSDEKKMIRYARVMVVMVIFLAIESIAGILIVHYPFPLFGMWLVVIPLLTISIIGSIYVLRESPNPFTVSMIIILILTIIAAVTHMIDLVATAPQFFILQVLPVVVAVGVMGSMLKPWRNIITISMLSLIVSVGPALFIPAFIANNMTIFLFTGALTFALVCLIVPLSFFLQQAVETKASTALYISVSLIAIGLLALTHGNNFAIANSPIGAWDEAILFLDWFFGVFAVSCFTMAAIAASFSTNVRSASREIIIGIAASLLVLGHPIVRWVEVEGTLIQRWELDPLYLGILSLLAVAFIVFFKMSYQLWKVGSGRAGLRFVFFMFAALFLGIVAMFADMIPLDLLVPLLVFAGVMLILSSPRKNPLAITS